MTIEQLVVLILLTIGFIAGFVVRQIILMIDLKQRIKRNPQLKIELDKSDDPVHYRLF